MLDQRRNRHDGDSCSRTRLAVTDRVCELHLLGERRRSCYAQHGVGQNLNRHEVVGPARIDGLHGENPSGRRDIIVQNRHGYWLASTQIGRVFHRDRRKLLGRIFFDVDANQPNARGRARAEAVGEDIVARLRGRNSDRATIQVRHHREIVWDLVDADQCKRCTRRRDVVGEWLHQNRLSHESGRKVGGADRVERARCLHVNRQRSRSGENSV